MIGYLTVISEQFLRHVWNSLPFGKLWFFNENYLLAIKLRIFRIKRSCKELHVIITISLLSYVVKKYYIKQSTGAIEFMYVAFIVTYVPSAIMLRRNPLSRVCYVYICYVGSSCCCDCLINKISDSLFIMWFFRY